MKREYCAAALLLILALLSAWSIRRINSLTEEIEATLLSSREAAENGDTEQAMRQAEEALSIWLNAKSYTHIFIRHAETDSTADAFYELLSAIAEGESDTLSPAYDKLIYHLDCIAMMERVSLGSIL